MKKTLRSRIAAVAVAALGLGLIQAAPAFAALTEYDKVGKFVFDSTNSTYVCTRPASIVADGDALTAHIAKAGVFWLKPTAATAATTDAEFTVTGGTISYTADTTTPVAATLNAAATSLQLDFTATTAIYMPTAVKFTPTGGVDMVITYKSGTLSSGTLGSTTTVFTYTVTPDCGGSASFTTGALADGTVGMCVTPTSPAFDGVVKTGLMRTDGIFVLKSGSIIGADSPLNLRITVSGGSMTYTKGTTETTDVLNSARTSITMTGVAGKNTPTLKFSPTAAGSMQILLEYGSLSGTVFTVVGTGQTWNFTVATSCANAAYSATYSTVNLATSASTFAATDSTGANRRDNGATGYVNVSLKDAYNTAITSGYLSATATGDAFVTWASNAETSNDFLAVTGGTNSLKVVQAKRNVPVTTTITIQFNGVTIGTKTLTIRGALAKLSVSGEEVALRGSSLTGPVSNTGALLGYLVASDSAGNTLSTDNYTYTFSGLDTQVQVARHDGYYGAAYGFGGISWTCGAGSGSSKLKASAVSEDGTTITSNEFTAACAGGVYKYTATLDKKEYAAGDTAVLTITATDSSGKPVYSFTAPSATASSVTGRYSNPLGAPMLGTYTITGYGADATGGTADDVSPLSENLPVITGGPLKFVVDPQAKDTFYNGKKEYTMIVKSGNEFQSGNFVLVVNLPRYNSDGVQTAVTIPYTVKAQAVVADPSITALTKAVSDMITAVNAQMAAMTTSIQLLVSSFSSTVAKLLAQLAKKK